MGGTSPEGDTVSLALWKERWRMAWLGLPQRQVTSQEAMPINSGGGLSSGPDAAPQRTLGIEDTLTVTRFPFPLIGKKSRPREARFQCRGPRQALAAHSRPHSACRVRRAKDVCPFLLSGRGCLCFGVTCVAPGGQEPEWSIRLAGPGFSPWLGRSGPVAALLGASDRTWECEQMWGLSQGHRYRLARQGGDLF